MKHAASLNPDHIPLLQVTDLAVQFRTDIGEVHAVNGVSFTLEAGEAFAIVGESGSGKTVTGKAILGILPVPPAEITKGSVRLRGVDLLQLDRRSRRSYGGERLTMVFQDALTALDPRFKVGQQIAELFQFHRGLGRAAAWKEAIRALDRVGIPSADKRASDYPHQFSGGMQQRVLIAMAIALEPEVVIADEPTTALDVTVQAQVLELLHALRVELDMALILITHDLAVAAETADRVAVMYAGRIVETGYVAEVFRDPHHPYTLGLLGANPRAERRSTRELYQIPGEVPDLANLPKGCPFAPRCGFARDRCREELPRMRRISSTARLSACHFAEKVAGHEP